MATIPIYRPVDESWFDHIKIDHTNWDGRCPLEDEKEEIKKRCVIDPDSDHMSWLLSQILDRRGLANTREIVSNRRRLMLMEEFIQHRSGVLYESFRGGSVGDGFSMIGRDVDTMAIDTLVMVMYRDQCHLLPDDTRHTTVLFMREAGCQPGYVVLELWSLGQRCSPLLQSAIVPVEDSLFVSSDMFKHELVEMHGRQGTPSLPNGPCSRVVLRAVECDFAFSFPCTCWPKDAEEWVYRTRLYGWPSQELRDKIVRSGCHLVPVGDKCSSDTFLQWRLSFITAERRLIHSLSHQQFRIYGLLKCFLKQIKPLLGNTIGDSDILCSYFIKTLIFHAVENSPTSLWQEKHTYVSFMFCLRILIEWIKNSNCPNYFIKNNNLFKRKIHGENQQKLLHILTDMYDVKWASLSVGTVYQPSIGKLLHMAVHGQSYDVLPPRGECDRDMDIFDRLVVLAGIGNDTKLKSPMKLLSESQSDTDEFIAYYLTSSTLYNIAMSTFAVYTTPGSNKKKYRDIRKCKRCMTPRAAMCTSPGLLDLATLHYNTGNYKKSLEMCGEVTSYPRCYLGNGTECRGRDRYQQLYCGRGYSLYHKLKEGCVQYVVLFKFNLSFCLPHLRVELTTYPQLLLIPPLPYAVFLSFLCYHDLGDTKRRDAALLHLRAVNYDPEQGGHKHWIVHTLLGICYQTVGDNRRAIRSYMESVHVQQQWNPAKERIEAIRCSE